MEKQESGADFWGKSHQEIPSFLLSQAKPTAFGLLHRLVALTFALLPSAVVSAGSCGRCNWEAAGEGVGVAKGGGISPA